ncbi:MAG: endolytic transglycosylase MltG [Clostridiales bacterium]|nr:endolytic transglycosylase MltG [Clostridiales bacterium]
MNDEKRNDNQPQQEPQPPTDATEVAETVVLGDTDGENQPETPKSVTPDISQSRKERVESFRVEISDEVLEGTVQKPSEEQAPESYMDFSSIGEQEEPGHTRKIDLPEDLKKAGTAGVSEEKGVKEKKDRKKIFTPGVGCLKSSIYAMCVVVVSILLAGFILMGVNDMLGLIKSDKEVEVTIPVGATSDDVAQILQDNGVISQPFFFKLYSGLVKKDDAYEAGTFSVNTKWGYDQIVNRLRATQQSSEVVRVTFPEGYTLKQIASKLEKEGVCTARSFMDRLDEGGFETSMVSMIEPDADRYTLLEGYLFPDTYDFYVGESASNVISKFLNNLESKFTAEIRKRCEEIGMTPDEVLTLASIVQKEAGNLEEMKRVASVFLNRLKPGSPYPMLQSDPTMNYESGKYNTYEVQGLPPGPICNPGLDAISAVLYPEDTNYYFFVTDADMNYYYAETFDQHLKNCAKAGISVG